jgi:hypothetical protein
MFDKVVVNNEEDAFRVIKQAAEKLMNEGYKEIDIITGGRDEDGNFTVTVTPREEEKK